MNSFKSFVSKIKSNKYFKFFTNFYIVVSLFFIIWMLFIDTNSYLFHNTLNSDIDQLIIKKDDRIVGYMGKFVSIVSIGFICVHAALDAAAHLAAHAH